MILGGGLRQRIRVEFFFPRQLAVELFFPGRVAVVFYFPAFARAPPPPEIINGSSLTSFKFSSANEYFALHRT